MTRSCFLVVALMMTITSLQAQYASITDAAYLTTCRDEADRYACTDSIIAARLTMAIEQSDACQEVDSVTSFNASWMVDKNGLVQTANLYHSLGRDTVFDCGEAAQADFLPWLQGQSFEPARKGRKRTMTSKRLTATHGHLTAYSTDESDTTAINRSEEMPRFRGCEDIAGSRYDKEICAETKMLMHLYRNLKYPPDARERGIQGTVIIAFVIEKDGRLSNLSIAREIGGGCGDAALEAVKSLNKLKPPFIPGRQDSKVVRVQYKMPVRFKLA